ncbi:hypothetical protein SLS62_003472 [Diatrype stigma]|uniref:Protein Zds1 C-terminal domain-containing protein n=1 Tax=Diatrype stigma TaxID=117547 RepID=A0AAN9UW83_9PEZI
MQTSNRPRDAGGSFASRRGHGNQLSISDTSHHITETIGTLYGDDEDYPNNDASRPMSFLPSSRAGGEQISDYRRSLEPSSPEQRRPRLARATTADEQSSQNQPNQPNQPPALNLNGNSMNRSPTAPSRMPSQRGSAHENGSLSPLTPASPASPTLREMQDGHSEFPLTNIEDPNNIAQELSNLQALRRMSMDVSNHSDPDLLPFQGMSLMAMPSVAPSRDDDESDPSRLLWVPAGVHPELAPSEFKNFLEKRVQSIKRRSGESSLSVDGLDRSDSGSLRRKKSMLSRQVDNVGHHAERYLDGAERLEMKKSENQEHDENELTLDDLVNDPTKAVQRLALESKRHESGLEGPSADDMPILPAAPGMGLRRSTRTTYRKGGSLKDRSGSLKKDQLPFSKRIAARTTEEGAGTKATESSIDAPPGYGLTRVRSEPVAENFSRPSSKPIRPIRRQQTFTVDSETGNPLDDDQVSDSSQELSRQAATSPPTPAHASVVESSRTATPVPQIIETPIAEEPSELQTTQQDRPYPERSSSTQAAAQAYSQPSSVPEEPPARSSRRPHYGQHIQNISQQPAPVPASAPVPAPAAGPPSRSTRTPSGSNHALNEIQQSPTPLPGSGGTRTDSLTFIPTFATEEKKSEKKSKKEKGDADGGSSRTSSWFRFKSEDKEKKKKDEKEDKKSKAKALAAAEKAHDNVRLDVLQTSIETGSQKSNRESLVLDRDSYDGKLDEERRKESSRKSSEHKKEKDGLFASFFGSKKRGDRDSSHKKSHSQRAVSPEPAPYRALQPDVDYHWTRFPILEERAIYRMAHIKLANPRRALYSQVLLSNFMYAYLAKVQAMHPQIQVPQSPAQKRQAEEERKRREQEQKEQEEQGEDSFDRYNYDYHRSAIQYAESGQDGGDYAEDSEAYDYGQDRGHGGHDPSRQGDNKDYYSYGTHGGSNGDKREDDDNDMW